MTIDLIRGSKFDSAQRAPATDQLVRNVRRSFRCRFPIYVVRQSPPSASGERERILASMFYLILKSAISGVIVAIVSEVAKRYPGFGGLIASLPLVSVLGMIWLWRDTHDPARMAAPATGTFWFVLPSLPMFLLIPELLRRGVGFWPA